MLKPNDNSSLIFPEHLPIKQVRWQGINVWTSFGHTGTSVSKRLQNRGTNQIPEIIGF